MNVFSLNYALFAGTCAAPLWKGPPRGGGPTRAKVAYWERTLLLLQLCCLCCLFGSREAHERGRDTASIPGHCHRFFLQAQAFNNSFQTPRQHVWICWNGFSFTTRRNVWRCRKPRDTTTSRRNTRRPATSHNCPIWKDGGRLDRKWDGGGGFNFQFHTHTHKWINKTTTQIGGDGQWNLGSSRWRKTACRIRYAGCNHLFFWPFPCLKSRCLCCREVGDTPQLDISELRMKSVYYQKCGVGHNSLADFLLVSNVNLQGQLSDRYLNEFSFFIDTIRNAIPEGGLRSKKVKRSKLVRYPKKTQLGS